MTLLLWTMTAVSALLGIVFPPFWVGVILFGLLAIVSSTGDALQEIANFIAKKECPHCRSRIDRRATICPHCRSDLTAASDAPKTEATPTSNEPRKICPSCGAETPRSQHHCHSCGHDFERAIRIG